MNNCHIYFVNNYQLAANQFSLCRYQTSLKVCQQIPAKGDSIMNITSKMITTLFVSIVALGVSAEEPSATDGFDVRTTFELSIKAPTLDRPRVAKPAQSGTQIAQR